jgi:mannose-6-phosphate isomerase-like protein (cupin superfamily)
MGKGRINNIKFAFYFYTYNIIFSLINIIFMEEEVSRPWGTYQTIMRGQTYQVKRIVVNPKQQLSLQSHNHRSEHWTVVEGVGTITLDKETIQAPKDKYVYIPVKSVHRMANQTDEPVVFIEVQNGDYLGEDDIIRYEDVYGRK